MSPEEKIREVFSPLLQKDLIVYEDLLGALQKIELDEIDIQHLFSPDKHHPYGRKIIINTPKLEIMVASWNDNWRCAPHDHGDSISAILILQGTSHHIGYSIEHNTLKVVFQEKKHVGEILTCDPLQVHSMCSTGKAPLITLHCYSSGIQKMVLYDQKQQQTIIVPGECGAWLPVDDPQHIYKQVEGFVSNLQIHQQL